MSHWGVKTFIIQQNLPELLNNCQQVETLKTADFPDQGRMLGYIEKTRFNIYPIRNNWQWQLSNWVKIFRPPKSNIGQAYCYTEISQGCQQLAY